MMFFDKDYKIMHLVWLVGYFLLKIIFKVPFWIRFV